MAIEVNDIMTNNLLSMNTVLEPAQKLVIKPIFLECRVITQVSCLISKTYISHMFILFIFCAVKTLILCSIAPAPTPFNSPSKEGVTRDCSLKN